MLKRVHFFLLLHFTESVAYEFGAGRGLIQYQFPLGNQPDTEEDNIALGFITTRTDAVLLRIESLNTQDYFELEIVSRIIFFPFFCHGKIRRKLRKFHVSNDKRKFIHTHIKKVENVSNEKLKEWKMQKFEGIESFLFIVSYYYKK
jgi:hypothetical protein